jgi:glutathione peroxidase
MNRKRIALAAFALAVTGIAVLAVILLLRGFAARGPVVDAIAPIATISEGNSDETAGDALVPGDNGAQFLPVPPPLDDDRVVDAMGPLAKLKLACHRDDPPDGADAGSDDEPADALDAPLALWSEEEQRAGTEPLLAAALAPLTPLPASQIERLAEAAKDRAAETPADCPALLQQEFRRLQTGESQSLCQFRGKVLLVVNTASYCGYTGQYEGLEALYRKYKGRGLVVVGFPSNDFGGQEPGTNTEIAQFCRLTYGVQFPMFEKSSVAKVGSNPLFAALAASTGVAPQWNFYKYVVDRHGRAIAGFDSRTTPDDRVLVQLIERLLADRATAG